MIFLLNMTKKIVIGLDNYFTLPKVVKKFRDVGIGVIGTERFRKGCPPEKLRKSNKKMQTTMTSIG